MTDLDTLRRLLGPDTVAHLERLDALSRSEEEESPADVDAACADVAIGVLVAWRQAVADAAAPAERAAS